MSCLEEAFLRPLCRDHRVWHRTRMVFASICEHVSSARFCEHDLTWDQIYLASSEHVKNSRWRAESTSGRNLSFTKIILKGNVALSQVIWLTPKQDNQAQSRLNQSQQLAVSYAFFNAKLRHVASCESVGGRSRWYLELSNPTLWTRLEKKLKAIRLLKYCHMGGAFG